MARTENPNKHEIENDILEKALRMFSEKGYRNTTIEDISSLANLRKTSVYHYFKNKEEIFFLAMKMNLERSLASLAKVLESTAPPAEKLRQAIDAQVRIMADAPYILNLFIGDSPSLSKARQKACLRLRDKHEEILQGIVKEGIAEGVFENVDASVTVKLIFGALNWLSVWWKPTGQYGMTETSAIFSHLLVDKMLKK